MINIDKKKLLGRGATAKIYEAREGSKVYAAKIYTNNKQINLEKIQAMITHSPKDSIMKIDGRSFNQFAWPTKIIYSDKKIPIGFLMPLIDLKNSFSLDVFYDKVLFNKLKSPNEIALTFKLAIAKNLCNAIVALHKEQHFFIDLKPQNIRVFKGTHAVTLLDCDGFSIKSKSKKYPAELISTDYISPEATKGNLPPKQLGVEQDLYALGVILFQLLNNGTHPFQGISNKKLSTNTNDEKAAKGFYPHGLLAHSSIKPRPQSIHNSWLKSTRVLFEKSFTGNSKNRPSAQMWAKHFDEILSKKYVVRCSKKPNDLTHLRFKDMDCPECYLLKINPKLKISTNSNKTSKPSGGFAQKSSSQSTKPSYSSATVFWILAATAFFFYLIFGNDSDNDSKTSSINSESTKSNQAKYEIDRATGSKIINSNTSPIKTESTKDCTKSPGSCYGSFTYPNGNNYVGEFKDGKRHGQGTFTYKTGENYVGEWKDNNFWQGTFTYTNGDQYVGEHKDNKRHGQGAFTYINGAQYKGGWKDGNRHGQGTYKYINGDQYIGEYKNGKKHGQGTYKYINGDQYVGEYKNANRHGQGTYTYENSDRYVGEFIDDKMHGYGTYTYVEGDQYVGEFIDDRRNGYGTNSFKNGDQYVGEWKDNKSHGYGTYTYLNGAQEEGEWKDNEFLGSRLDNNSAVNNEEYRLAQEKIKNEHEELQKANGSTIYSTPQRSDCLNSSGYCYGKSFVENGEYEGDFFNGIPQGQGTYSWTRGANSGDQYVGGYKNNKRHGQGTYTFKNGENYAGEYKEDKMHGYGNYTYANGDSYIGQYEDNQLTKGTYFWNKGEFAGDKYEGSFLNTNKHGYGIYTRANGDSFNGQFRDNQMAKGTYSWNNGKFAGDKYEGSFLNANKHGYGVYTRANGEQIKGEFKDNKYVGSGSESRAIGGALDWLKDTIKTSPDTIPSSQNSFGN
ncbi:protein kinase [Methylophilaceae bacterium]|nr:protein kinase [Methylophilaceae bacterium]